MRVLLALLSVITGAKAQVDSTPQAAIVRTVDLAVGETAEMTLADKRVVRLKLIGVDEKRDTIREAVREATVKVEVDGETVSLVSGNYRLPVTVGKVQIDCPITGGYRKNTTVDVWGLDKDARLRIWPAGSGLMHEGTFQYPLRQRWFASATQMANEPVFVDGGEQPFSPKIYYHWGLDMGGAEDMIDVRAATEGLVVSAGTAVLPGYEKTPIKPRYDVIYLEDPRGWLYRYSHLAGFRPEIKVGARVKIGQTIGTLGKEGASGGWSHLHFDINSKQPSGKWGIHEGYAYLWEAYAREHRPKLIAVARPHRVCWADEAVEFDGSRSWSSAGRPLTYEWQFQNGTTASGAKVSRTYTKPGCYSEILRVADDQGNIEYDFAAVQVLNKEMPRDLPPTIHAAYAPKSGDPMQIKAGDEVVFKVRSFRTTHGQETWDFGDGSEKVQVRSDGNVKPLAKDGYAVTTHRFAKAGQYIVRVERSNERGETATGHLLVRVERP